MSIPQKHTSVRTRRSKSLSTVFAFADTRDYLFMFFGAIGAAITGFSIPSFHILFGEMLDSLNGDRSSFQEQVNLMSTLMGVIAAINLVSGMIQVCVLVLFLS